LEIGHGSILFVAEEGDETPAAIKKARDENASKSRSRSRGRMEMHTSGRGGRGNIRSASRGEEGREQEKKLEREEKAVEDKYKAAVASGTTGAKGISSGRGTSHFLMIWYGSGLMS
jgi:hypothetical protein